MKRDGLEELGIVIYAEQSLQPDWNNYIQRYEGCGRIIGAAPDQTADTADAAKIQLLTWKSTDQRTRVLEQAVAALQTPWRLVIGSDEYISLGDIAAFLEQAEPGGYGIGVRTQNNEHTINYQPRLFHQNCCLSWQGAGIPVPVTNRGTAFIDANEGPIIRKYGPLYRKDELVKEVEELETLPARTKLWYAIYVCEELEAYDRAGRLLDDALDSPSLAKPDQIAALNARAHLCLKQDRWDRVEELLIQSLGLEKQQALPWLLQYEIEVASGRWPRAFEALEHYERRAQKLSSANFDVQLNQRDFHVVMSEAAERVGKSHEALNHYVALMEFTDDPQVGRWAERCIQIALDLGQTDTAKRHFRHLIEMTGPEPAEQVKNRLVEMVSLFTASGAYEAAANCFNALHEVCGYDSVMVRRWVAALVKAGKIEEARKLLAGHSPDIKIRGLSLS